LITPAVSAEKEGGRRKRKEGGRRRVKKITLANAFRYLASAEFSACSVSMKGKRREERKKKLEMSRASA